MYKPSTHAYHDALVQTAIDAVDKVANDKAMSASTRRDSIMAVMHHGHELLHDIDTEEEDI